MTPNVEVGSILIGHSSPRMAGVFALESEPYFENWSVIKSLNGLVLDAKIHAAGWNFFFLAGEVKVMFFGAAAAQRVQNALRRILAKVKGQDFNCLEVTGIVARRCLGVPYTIVTAHSRHIQQGCQLDGIEGRRNGRPDAD